MLKSSASRFVFTADLGTSLHHFQPVGPCHGVPSAAQELFSAAKLPNTRLHVAVAMPKLQVISQQGSTATNHSPSNQPHQRSSASINQPSAYEISSWCLYFQLKAIVYDWSWERVTLMMATPAPNIDDQCSWNSWLVNICSSCAQRMDLHKITIGNPAAGTTFVPLPC